MENMQDLERQMSGMDAEDTAPAPEPEETPVDSPEDSEPDTGDEPSDQESTPDAPETDTDSESSEDEKPEQEPESKKEPDDKSNAAFARLRAENSTYKKALKAFALANDMSEDEAVAALEEQALQKQAKDKNVDPSVLKEMDELRQYNQNMKEQFVMVGLKQLQDRHGMNDNDVAAFAQRAADKGINLFETSMEFDTLYKALHHDDIVAKAVKEAEQKLQERLRKADKAPSAVTKGAGESADKKVSAGTMSDLEKALARMG